MIKAVLNVEGMSCSHCENAIKKAVGALDGVGSVTVDLKQKTVTVEYESSNATLERIKNEIEDQGYDVQ
jgi:copper chaperone